MSAYMPTIGATAGQHAGRLGNAVNKMNEINRLSILGCPVACIDMTGLTSRIAEFIAHRGPDAPGRFVCFRDVHGLVAARDDRTLFEAHEQASFVVADGRPLSVIGRMMGDRDIRQVRGIDSVPTLCEAGIEPGWRHYFLGGAPGVADRLAAEMSQRFPGLIVAGTECPPFRPLSEAEENETVDRIVASRADIVWVGLGSPKQDLWMARMAPRLHGAVCMGVGAAFDIHTGKVRQAPRAIQKLGLEWAFRLVQEPRRLAKRYGHAIPRFLMLVTGDLLRRRPGAGVS